MTDAPALTPRASIALRLTFADNERRRALTLAPGLYRADAMGWARDLTANARKRRLATTA